MIWFTSDLHFGHESIIRYCNRPFKTLENMHESLIHNWNSRVKESDTIYILGDLALCSYKEFEPLATRLNGKKYLIKGNHDHYSDVQYQKLGITVVYELKIKLAGQMVRLSHYPYALPWHLRPFAYESELRFLDRRPPKIIGEFLLHGHTHSKIKHQKNMIHVGADAWGFSPVSKDLIESTINKIKAGKLK